MKKNIAPKKLFCQIQFLKKRKKVVQLKITFHRHKIKFRKNKKIKVLPHKNIRPPPSLKKFPPKKERNLIIGEDKFGKSASNSNTP